LTYFDLVIDENCFRASQRPYYLFSILMTLGALWFQISAHLQMFRSVLLPRYSLSQLAAPQKYGFAVDVHLVWAWSVCPDAGTFEQVRSREGEGKRINGNLSRAQGARFATHR
jgi:hypothetical protein